MNEEERRMIKEEIEKNFQKREQIRRRMEIIERDYAALLTALIIKDGIDNARAFIRDEYPTFSDQEVDAHIEKYLWVKTGG